MKADSARAYRRVAALWAVRALLPALLVLAACRQAARVPGSHAGEAIGIEARHTAVVVAQRVADQVDPACGSYALTLGSGPVTVSVLWRMEGARGERSALELEERRRLEIDGRGRVRYRREAIYRSELGQEGRRWREWRIIDGQIYLRDLNLPFQRRPIDVVELTDRLREAPEVFSTLVELTGSNWTDVTRSDDGWTLAVSGQDGTPADGRPVRCGGLARRDPWLGDLLAQVVVRRADARVIPDDAEGGVWPEERTGTWLLEAQPVGDGAGQGREGSAEGPGLSLRVEVQERVEAAEPEEPIEVPEAIFDVSRRRPTRSVQHLLEAIDELESGE